MILKIDGSFGPRQSGAERPALGIEEFGPVGGSKVVPEVGPEADLIGGSGRVDVADAGVANGQPFI